jgi:hypothetical protein
MSVPQQQASVASFGTPAPPPYTPQAQSQPLATPGSAAQYAVGQMQAHQQNGFLQGHPQMQDPQGQVYPQQPQLVQSPQETVFGQQPLQYPPKMTPQQQQQVTQIIQNMPPEKVQMLQQHAQQMTIPQQMASPQQMMNNQSFQQPQSMIQQPVPQQPVQQHGQKRHYTTSAPSGLFGRKHSSGSHEGTGPKDEKQTGGVQRFFGDTLFGRVARSSVQTATSAMKMPSSLSPWGDNNPVTLPNVRYRDAVLFTTFAFVGTPLVEGISDGVAGAFGADSFVSEIVNSGAGVILGSTIIKYSVFQIVEQAIDKGIIEHLLPEEEKMLQTTNVKSLQVGIKHKLMGVDADLRFSGIYPSRDSQACEKGWFCPYLFASARTPSLPRANDFSICQFFGPFLGGEQPTRTLIKSGPALINVQVTT